MPRCSPPIRRQLRLTGLALVVGALVALTGPRSRAYSAESEKTVAKAHYETATRFYDLREYAKALDEYKAAYMAKPDPAFLFNIGQCHRKLGNAASAIEFYQQYLKKTGPDDPNRKQAEARIRDIESGHVSDDDPFTKEDAKAPSVSDTAGATAPPTPPGAPVPGARPGAAANPIAPEATPAVLPPVRADLVTSSKTPEPVSPPLYARWWLWTAVGVAVVGGAAAAILISRSGSETNTAATTLGTQGAFQ